MKKTISIILAAVLALGCILGFAACSSGSKGITIAVPNDATNEARALLLLQEQGIIKLKDGAGITATIRDIEENPKNITFKEVEDIFKILEIDPSAMEESEKDHSSRAGRIYAYSGGVSEAVSSTLRRLNPDRKISIRTQAANGVPECKAMIEAI